MVRIPDFKERLSAAITARKAQIERARAIADDPARLRRIEARSEIIAARNLRIAERAGETLLPEAPLAAARPTKLAILSSVADKTCRRNFGCLLSYGPDFGQMWRRSAAYVDKILHGASPSDLPIEQPTKFNLFVSLGIAKALALEIPPSVLARADEVIE